ncbi:MAG: hypothetical protein HYY54_07425 [candidate division NC10 bacterium]|nr:hypothetical protein [candidate division NC10 bacterium]
MGEELREASGTRAAARTEGAVRIVYGIHALEAAVAGRTVAEIRQALAQPLNISPRAVAVVDGEVVAEGHLLQAGQQLEFVRLAGEKGAPRDTARSGFFPPLP